MGNTNATTKVDRARGWLFSLLHPWMERCPRCRETWEARWGLHRMATFEGQRPCHDCVANMLGMGEVA